MSLLLGAHYVADAPPAPAVGGFSNLGVTGTKRGSVTINNNGKIYGSYDSGAAIELGAWLDPQVGMSGYEVYCSPLVGDPPAPSGGFGTWMSCSVSRTWSVGLGGGARFLLQFRRAVDHVVVGTGDLFASGGGTLPDTGP